MPCSCPDAATPLPTALSCFLPLGKAPCVFHETSALHVAVKGLECASSADASYRGFFVISRDHTDTPVCTSGDAFHLRVMESNGDWQFSVLSQPIDTDHPAVYWMNTSAAQMLGTHTYQLSLSLVETPLRAQQRGDGGANGLLWTKDGHESPLAVWLRERRCLWRRVPLPDELRTISIGLQLSTNFLQGTKYKPCGCGTCVSLSCQ
jgi:hypothetical protein